MSQQLEITALPGVPHIVSGDDLAGLLRKALTRLAWRARPGDVLAVAQKVVSKAEGRLVALAGVEPSVQAVELARVTAKDARLVQLVLSEAKRVVRAAHGVLIVESTLGLVMANAGIDESNAGAADHALLLPLDPDASAARLASALGLPVVVTDSFGRPWRRGTVNQAIGAAGLPSLVDLRGVPDLDGRALRHSMTAFADEIAAAAGLVMGQAAEGLPAVLLRGLSWTDSPAPAAALLRPASEDLFR